MKIIGKLIQNEQFGSLKFFYGKVEERTVVCLEFYGSVCSQDFVIKLEKFVGCQSSSCMAGLWPWIGEVQVDTGYFRRGEYRRQVICIIQMNRMLAGTFPSASSSWNFSTARNKTLE